MPIIEKKVALIKILGYLTLSIPLELCEEKPEVFGRLFGLANNQNNLEIIENVLWLINSLLLLKESDEMLQKAIAVCIQYKVVSIVFNSIQLSNEKIVL